MSHNLQKRTALLLLCALWFQTGFALGAASLTGGSSFKLCRNGVLIEVTDGETLKGHATAVCVVCATGGVDGEPSAVSPQTTALLPAGVALHSQSRDENSELWPDALRPPSRAPPRVI